MDNHKRLTTNISILRKDLIYQLMYSKNFFLLLLANIVCVFALMLSRGDIVYGIEPVEAYMQAKDNAVQDSAVQSYEAQSYESRSYEAQIEPRASIQRVISYDTLKPSYCIKASDTDIETLMKIVQAEAGGEDRRGKLLVANVVINRVRNRQFPDNITDVVYQQSQNVTQFSPVSNGVINKVAVSEETKEVVYSALRGEDVSNGALFFMARKYTPPENAKWFDDNLTFLFSYGGHDFYTR